MLQKLNQGEIGLALGQSRGQHRSVTRLLKRDPNCQKLECSLEIEAVIGPISSDLRKSLGWAVFAQKLYIAMLHGI